LLSSILTNSEAWYKLKDQEINILEKCDEKLTRMVFETPCTTPKCMLYLESGVRPIRFYIMARRLMFLWYILNEDESSLMVRFFIAQEKNPCKGDWILTVKEDLEKLEIFLTLEQIKHSTREQFRSLVEKSIEEKAFLYLIKEKDRKDRTKVSHIQYQEHSMQKYLKSRKISNQLKKFIFILRSRMLDVSSNYPNKFSSKLCPVCRDGKSQDTQEHILSCPGLIKDNQLVKNLPKYDDLFSDNVDRIIEVASIIQERFRLRKNIMKTKTTSSTEEPSEPEAPFSVLQ
jgi:ferredoxin-thioredoxin reductase catalytic subunit